MARSNAGGGFGSRQVTEQPVRTGTGSRSTNPAYVGQLGQKQGSHITRAEDSNYRGEIMHRGGTLPTMFGNEVAANTVCGVGGSRTIYSSGTQSASGGHGSANPGKPRPVPGRHIIESYGPESSRPRNPNRSDTDADF